MEAPERRLDPALTVIGRKLLAGERLDMQDGLACLATRDLIGLGRLALEAKKGRYGDKAFFISNHHLNYTNICENRCRFCAFHRSSDSPDGYAMTPEEAAKQIAESPVADLREVHLVGGCHPELEFSYYRALLQALKQARPELRIKAFTAVEIAHIASLTHISTLECLKSLKEAGLSAMPGGGAEVFSARVREALFPRKIDAETWLRIHGEAHDLGIGTNATILFGHMETPAERIEHLLLLRDQQDVSGGFRAFVPLPFHPENTPLSSLPGPTAVDILKTIAASRLMLDNVDHIKAYWIMLGPRLAQTALHFGADDLEGTIVRERIAHQAGAKTAAGLTRDRLTALIKEAGFEPVQRDTFHQPVDMGQE